MGDKIPFGKRGRYGVVHGSIEEKFNPYHLMIETSSRDDFDTDKILQQVKFSILFHQDNQRKLVQVLPNFVINSEFTVSYIKLVGGMFHHLHLSVTVESDHNPQAYRGLTYVHSNWNG